MGTEDVAACARTCMAASCAALAPPAPGASAAPCGSALPKFVGHGGYRIPLSSSFDTASIAYLCATVAPSFIKGCKDFWVGFVAMYVGVILDPRWAPLKQTFYMCGRRHVTDIHTRISRCARGGCFIVPDQGLFHAILSASMERIWRFYSVK